MKAHSRHAEVELKDGTGATMLKRFEAFGRSLLRVPKKQIDQKLDQYEKRKRARKPARKAG